MSTRAPVRRRSCVDVLGSGLIVLGSLQFGGVVVLGKIVTDDGLPVPAYLAVRFAVAAVLLGAALAATRQPMAAARRERWPLAVLGMAGYGLEAGLFFAALRHGSAAAATLLFFTYPVIVTLLVAATGRGLPGGLVVVALCASVAGAVLVVAGHGLVISGVGVLFALAAALVFSLYLLGADAVLDRTNSLTGSMWVSAAAAVALAAAAGVSGTHAWPVGMAQWAPVLGSGAFTAGAFVCLLAGLRRIGPVRAAIVGATEPLAASVLAVIFLGESLGAVTVVGGTLILAGAVTASLARHHRPPDRPSL
ncbi:MAG TPA: DMT family transporter [Actinomycetes bacterium]|jgi:drug/metabolite transporter (DMT)-like permease|nr:DMT family transporter [Actinomycetes bacterium]